MPYLAQWAIRGCSEGAIVPPNGFNILWKVPGNVEGWSLASGLQASPTPASDNHHMLNLAQQAVDPDSENDSPILESS